MRTLEPTSPTAGIAPPAGSNGGTGVGTPERRAP
jgi:hypothetical protein